MTGLVKNLSANAGDVRDAGLIPGWGRSPGGGHGNPLQSSCLENPKGRGAWWAIVHGVAKSQTQLKRLSLHACTRQVCQFFAPGNGISACNDSKFMQPCRHLFFGTIFQTSLPCSSPSGMHSLPSCLMQLLLILDVTSHLDGRRHPGSSHRAGSISA